MSLRAVFNHEGQSFHVVPHRFDRVDPTDEVYDAKRHQGHLTNEAGQSVTLIDYVPSAGGDLYSPRRAHFRVKSEGPRGRSISIREKPQGYLIHVNTGSYTELFDKADAIEKRKAFKDYKKVSVGSAQELVDFMIKIGPEAWAASHIAHLDHIIPAPQFFVRYGRGQDTGKRFIDLVQRLEKAKTPLPCLMEIKTDKPTFPPTFKNLYVNSRQIEWGRRKIIAPEIMVPRRHEDDDRSLTVDVKNSFWEPGSYVVLGYAELKHDPDSKFYNVKMRVEDSKRIARIDFDQIALMQAKTAVGPVPQTL